MKLTNDNAFVGARVSYLGKDMTIIKVNEKSFYATEMTLSEFNDSFNKRLVGTTFVTFCKANDISSYKYSDNFEITAAEFSRKNTAVKNSIKSSFKLDAVEKKQILDNIKYFEKSKKSIKLFQFCCLKKTIRFIDIRDKSYLLNIDNNYILYSIDTDEVVKICSVYEYDYKEIPWELLSSFSKEMVA